MVWRLFLKKNEVLNQVRFLPANPAEGLPEDVFLLVSRLTPMINVDLLIKDREGRTLLTWRDDGYCNPGWHIPGGIIRYKESISDRIKKTALNEIGTEVKFIKKPLEIKEFVHPLRKNRGHFISLLYRCFLVGAMDRGRMFKSGRPKSGEWAWHDKCPVNLLSVHEVYRRHI